MPDLIDGFARLTPAERVAKSGDIFQEEFRRQLRALPRDVGQKSADRWYALQKAGRNAELLDEAIRGLTISATGGTDDADAIVLADHAEAICKGILDILLDDTKWETFNA